MVVATHHADAGAARSRLDPGGHALAAHPEARAGHSDRTWPRGITRRRPRGPLPASGCIRLAAEARRGVSRPARTSDRARYSAVCGAAAVATWRTAGQRHADISRRRGRLPLEHRRAGVFRGGPGARHSTEPAAGDRGARDAVRGRVVLCRAADAGVGAAGEFAHADPGAGAEHAVAGGADRRGGPAGAGIAGRSAGAVVRPAAGGHAAVIRPAWPNRADLAVRD